MDSCALKQSTQKSLKGQSAEQMGLLTISPPPGLEHLVNLAPPPGLESQGLQNQAQLQWPPGNFRTALQRPPGIFADRYLPPPGNFNFPCAWQPVRALGWHMPPSAQQPRRPPGHWDNISVASTACTAESTPILGSPRRAPSVASDEDGMMQFPRIEHRLMEELGVGKFLQEEFNEEVFDENVDVCSSLLEAGVHAESKEQQAQVDDGASRINWQVDAKKLSSMERQIISPSFQISEKASVKIMLKAKGVGSRKGQASFKKSRGIGSVEVKFVEGSTEAPQLRLYVSVGDQLPRGPVDHDFGTSSVCNLPKDMEEWNFSSSVDLQSSSFLVSLHVLDVTSNHTIEEEMPA